MTSTIAIPIDSFYHPNYYCGKSYEDCPTQLYKTHPPEVACFDDPEDGYTVHLLWRAICPLSKHYCYYATNRCFFTGLWLRKTVYSIWFCGNLKNKDVSKLLQQIVFSVSPIGETIQRQAFYNQKHLLETGCHTPS